MQLVADVKPARACSKDTLFYWVHPEVKEVGCGTRQSKNLPKPYCVIIILLGCQQDVTGEVEECCSVAEHAESWDNEDTLPSLGMGHHTFGVAQERGGWPGWRGNGEGSQEGWKGGCGGDAGQLSCLCSAVAAVPEGCWEEAQLLLLLVLWG